MAIGFVLIKTLPARESDVYKELSKNEHVEELYILFGEFDLIAKLSAEDYDTLSQVVIEEIRAVDGVVDTRTLTGIKF